MSRIFATVLILTVWLSVFAQKEVAHYQYDKLLKKYVDEKGLVDYKGLKNNPGELKSYLKILENNPPNETWSRNEKLAYWINVYNAFTLDLILEHYPVSSIKDIGSTIQIPFVNTPWDIKFIKIGNEEYDLNNIEHGIIRKEFDDPRIHFALVCAAISCPKLQREAYTPEKLDQQLTNAAEEFLSNPEKNEIRSEKSAVLSKIFSWYGGDFTKHQSLSAYVSKYSRINLSEDAKISYKDYDWTLNEQ